LLLFGSVNFEGELLIRRSTIENALPRRLDFLQVDSLCVVRWVDVEELF
jgi:hypothetical protein